MSTKNPKNHWFYYAANGEERKGIRKSKFKAQEGRCAICGIFLELKGAMEGGNVAHLDHNHNTKTFRDVLCSNCNRGLGCFQDSRILLLKAFQYLKKHDLTINDPVV